MRINNQQITFKGYLNLKDTAIERFLGQEATAQLKERIFRSGYDLDIDIYQAGGAAQHTGFSFKLTDNGFARNNEKAILQWDDMYPANSNYMFNKPKEAIDRINNILDKIGPRSISKFLTDMFS
jgi:hypothetical protein